MIRVSAITDNIMSRLFYFLENDEMPSCADANMILIEDRILAIELLTSPDEAHTVNFVHDAEFETDVPLTLAGFLKQRRRWYNGNYISSVNMLIESPRLFKRACTLGLCGMFKQLIFMFSNFRTIFNMILLQSILLEGLYLWGG